MQSESVKAFKNDLRSYNYNLSRVVSLNNSIEFCYHRLSGVTAIDTSKQPIHSPPNKDYEYKLRDDIERFEALLKLAQAKIDYVDEILKLIETDVRKAVISVYVESKKMDSVASNMNLSVSGLQYQIDKGIERALNEKYNEEKI